MPSDINKKGKTILWYVETWFPALFAFATFALLIYFKCEVLLKFDNEWLSIKDIYFAVFNWAVLQVGFCFAVYALIVSKIKGFIFESRARNSMKRFRKYLMRGYWVGIFIAAITLVFIVLRPDLSKSFFYNYFILAIWASLFVFSFLSFIRILLAFQLIARIGEND